MQYSLNIQCRRYQILFKTGKSTWYRPLLKGLLYNNNLGIMLILLKNKNDID